MLPLEEEDCFSEVVFAIPALIFSLGTEAFFEEMFSREAGRTCFETLLCLETVVVEGF